MQCFLALMLAAWLLLITVLFFGPSYGLVYDPTPSTAQTPPAPPAPLEETPPRQKPGEAPADYAARVAAYVELTKAYGAQKDAYVALTQTYKAYNDARPVSKQEAVYNKVVHGMMFELFKTCLGALIAYLIGNKALHVLETLVARRGAPRQEQERS